MTQTQFAKMLAALAAAVALDAAAEPLPALNIDKSQTSVSGVSSGGYMAVQLHIAYSATFRKGTGIIAGGPYNCAEGSMLNVVNRCFGKAPIPVDALAALTVDAAKTGAIDPLDNLAASKVYLFAGNRDTVVNPATTRELQAYYLKFLPAANVLSRTDIEAEHAMVTDNYGASCTTKDAPFINNCGFDLAGAMLQHLYGALKPRSETTRGKLFAFDQGSFVTGHGMADSGWIYVPEECATGAQCRLHVALHGCKQNIADVGEAFVRHAGYNRWADGNRIVVLYPQTSQKALNSCWDWWGYDSADYARKSAPQMRAIIAMVEQLSAKP